MRTPKSRLLVITLGITLTGCAGYPSIQALTDKNTPMVANGFSVSPPQGSGWHFSQSADSIEFYKALNSPAQDKNTPNSEPHTFVISLDTKKADPRDIASAESLMRYTGRFVTTLSPERRQRLISHNTSHFAWQGTDCVRYEGRIEEQPRKQLLNLWGRGFVCRHPNAPDHVVRGAYSDRHDQSAAPPAAEVPTAEAERVLQSVKFTPMR